MTDEMNSNPDTPEPAEGVSQWAIVEIYGHRRHAGRIRAEQKFGTEMLRIDVPQFAGADQPEPSEWVTHWYGAAAVFSITLTNQKTVEKINRPYGLPGRYHLEDHSADDGGEHDDHN